MFVIIVNLTFFFFRNAATCIPLLPKPGKIDISWDGLYARECVPMVPVTPSRDSAYTETLHEHSNFLEVWAGSICSSFFYAI